MRKKNVFMFFAAIFMVGTMAANAPFIDCHAYACEVAEFYANSGSNPSLSDIEMAYHAAYTNCQAAKQ